MIRFGLVTLMAIMLADSALAVNLGDRVLVNWERRGFDYVGKVTRIEGDKLSIEYDDQTTEVAAVADVHGFDWKTGDKVSCLWKGDDSWYPATIVSLADPGLHVRYEDGSEEDTVVLKCRRKIEVATPVPTPTAPIFPEAFFVKLEAAIRGEDQGAFAASVHPQALEANLVGDSGKSLAGIFKQATFKQWFLKPDLSKAEKKGTTALLVPCSIRPWQADSKLSVVALVVLQDDHWLLLGVGQEATEVATLADRWCTKQLRVPDLPTTPEACFAAMEAASRAEDREAFVAAVHPEVIHASLADGSANGPPGILPLATYKKSILKPELSKATKRGETVMLVPCSLRAEDAGREEPVVAALALQGGHWLFLGAGPKGEDVGALVDRWLAARPPVPAVPTTPEACFAAMEGAIRAEARDAFLSAVHPVALGANLVGDSGIPPEGIFKQATSKKWFLKPDLSRAETRADRAMLVPCSLQAWEADPKDSVVALVVLQDDHWLLLGVGQEAKEVAALADRWLARLSLTPQKGVADP